jgi:hypothetical protein
LLVDNLGPAAAYRDKRWHADVTAASPLDLIRQHAAAIGQYDSGHALHENAVLVGHLLRPPHENPAWPVDDMSLGAAPDEAEDIVL